MDGVLCINKPQGFTSFDVVAKMRGIARQKRIGHAGTLDPMATGVLPLFLGKATGACDRLPSGDKRYTARFQLGMITDTQDSTGRVLERRDSRVDREALEEACRKFTGELSQVPPMYSAIKIGGKRLYEIARQGGEIERPPRPVTIYRLELLEFSEETQSGILDVTCSKGTYIRTLCHDMGLFLKTGGMMTELCRTQAAGFSLEDCITLEQAQNLGEQGLLAQSLLPVERLFAPFPKVLLSEAQARMFQNGVKLDLKRISWTGEQGRQRVYGPENRFLGLGLPRLDQGVLAIDKLF